MEPGEGPGWDLSPPAKQAFYNENAHGQPAKSRAASAQADAEKKKQEKGDMGLASQPWVQILPLSLTTHLVLGKSLH